ncbi:MAG: hypothetical protein P8P98_08670 [Emcibacteraceae bacterium]|nr:hypothetical protein [Emcibacteraceae bacterium]MDG1996216.1 hypothetical protein [Emcibacteraceae bacterium]
MQKSKLTVFAAVAIWMVLLWPALKNMTSGGNDSGFFGDLIDQAKDPLQKFASEFFTHVNDFSFGGFMFLGGLFVLTVGSVLTTLNRKK